MKKTALALKTKIVEAVKKNSADGMLFSGGLDTAILMGINPKVKAITINLKPYGEDVRYACLLAKLFKLEHYQKDIGIEEAIEMIPTVIKILRSFDPALPNDLAVYFGLREAKKLGIKKVMTGDASDELFAGYDFMRDRDDLSDYIHKITGGMQFSTNQLGEFFGLGISQPYMDKQVIDFALGIDTALKIKRQNGEVWGKWILRKAFEDILPREIIWQTKRPLEYGSGMTHLREIITSRVSEREFREAEREGRVKFINKEHFYYYQIYRDVVGAVPEAGQGERKCSGCGTGLKTDAYHCKLCGATYL